MFKSYIFQYGHTSLDLTVYIYVVLYVLRS